MDWSILALWFTKVHMFCNIFFELVVNCWNLLQISLLSLQIFTAFPSSPTLSNIEEIFSTFTRNKVRFTIFHTQFSIAVLIGCSLFSLTAEIQTSSMEQPQTLIWKERFHTGQYGDEKLQHRLYLIRENYSNFKAYFK